ncbi:hypothetical protein AB6A40_001132 [Gnathostoma spinigerum]|uniref:Uncharacterized protein n=1 Tax=Gnathostoma spinigerum TaxID=75299 RepID=A0ABD6E3H5_9BILA
MIGTSVVVPQSNLPNAVSSDNCGSGQQTFHAADQLTPEIIQKLAAVEKIVGRKRLLRALVKWIEKTQYFIRNRSSYRLFDWKNTRLK